MPSPPGLLSNSIVFVTNSCINSLHVSKLGVSSASLAGPCRIHYILSSLSLPSSPGPTQVLIWSHLVKVCAPTRLEAPYGQGGEVLHSPEPTQSVHGGPHLWGLQMRVEERSSDQGAISGCPGREGVVGQKPDSKGYMQVGDAADTQSAKKFGSWEGKKDGPTV